MSLFYRYWLVQRENAKRLQIGTDMLLITTDTGEELHKGINVDDFERS